MLNPDCFYVRNGKCYKEEPCELHMRPRYRKITLKAKVVKLPESRGSLQISLDKNDYIVSASDQRGWGN